MNVQRRLDRLEVEMIPPALRHAEQLLAARVPPDEWPDDALNAYLDSYLDSAPPATKAWLESLTGDELEALIEGRADAPAPPPGVWLA